MEDCRHGRPECECTAKPPKLSEEIRQNLRDLYDLEITSADKDDVPSPHTQPYSRQKKQDKLSPDDYGMPTSSPEEIVEESRLELYSRGYGDGKRAMKTAMEALEATRQGSADWRAGYDAGYRAGLEASKHLEAKKAPEIPTKKRGY